MRLRSSIRKASQTVKCLREDADVKPKPHATNGNVSAEIKYKNPNSSSLIPKNPPLICRNESVNKRVKKDKKTPVIPEDPYLFVDIDSDDNKENINPNSSKDITKKCSTKQIHSVVKAKAANPKRSKSKQWCASTAFTKQYIPPEKFNIARYECTINAGTPQSIITAIPLVSKTVNFESTPTLPESKQSINPRNLTASCSTSKNTFSCVESNKVSSNFLERVSGSCQVANSVSNTPELEKGVSIHNVEGSITRHCKTTLTSLNPRIASTPAISNPNNELQMSVGCRALIPTPINYTSNKRNENSHNDSSQVVESNLPNNPSSDTHSAITDNESSSKDLSKESTSSSGRRRKRESESERQVCRFFMLFRLDNCIT
ncbi:unnamed protein product [Schistosoma turkestanicum]|nr:unnamed protein product [Schistosoma turkestanicum]